MTDASTSTPSRIVVVDDEIIMQEMLRMMFDRNREFDVVAACGTTAECLSVLQEQHVDAILLDLGLPDTQGRATIEALRHIAPDSKILVVSGRDDSDSVRQAREAGADGYVVKGDPRRIVEGLRRVVRGEHVVDLGRGSL